MGDSADAATWSTSVEHRPHLWFPARSAFEDGLLPWAVLLTRAERRLLMHWAANLEAGDYVRWYDWAAGRRDIYAMYHVLRDPLPEGDPRRVPNHVETRAMRRRRALLEQEPELVYRMRLQMEADLRRDAQIDADLLEWFPDWERRQAERRERERVELERRAADRAEVDRVEAGRRQRAQGASCSRPSGA